LNQIIKGNIPPLGLMKISNYIKLNGGEIIFRRTPIKTDCDLICVSTLFTYDLEITINTIKTLALVNPTVPILVGGIAATVKSKKLKVAKNIHLFKGFSHFLDSITPDYSQDFQILPKWREWSFLFTTRGCPNSCGYCFVPKIEKGLSVINNWQAHFDLRKKFAMILDNNMTAFGVDHVKSVAKFLSDNKIKTCLDNAIDCKYLTKDMCDTLSGMPIVKRGIRTAFDRISEDGVFQKSIEQLIKSKISKYNIMAYVLYNYKDTPKEANYRAVECVKLGIAPYPARYKPIQSETRASRYTSPLWTDRLAIAFNHFWLMAGLYRKYSFEEYAKGIGKERYRLTEEDWSVWNEEQTSEQKILTIEPQLF
jgi:hypothetical protein